MEVKQRLGKVFYGYWVLLGAFILHALDSGIYFYGFSVFYTPLREEFGWSSALTAGAVSLSRLEGGIEGPLVGYLVDRFGARKLLALGAFLTGLGFILMTRVDSILMLYLVYGGVLSIGYNTGFTHSLASIIVHWFIKKRAKAMSIYAIAAGLGGAIIVPLIGRSITLYGWRATATYCGLAFWVVGLPMVLLFRNQPEDMGLLPDGEEPAEAMNPGPTGALAEEAEPQLTTMEALKSTTFRRLLLAEALRSFLLGSLVLHQIPHLITIGIDKQTGASILGLMILVSIPGRMLFGFLGDLMNKRLLLAAAMVIQGIGVLVFAYATSIVHVYVFVAVYGLAYGGAIPLLMAFRGDLFGRKRYATISGLMSPFKMIGNVGGPIFAGYVFDVTGSYRFAFTVFTVLAFLSAASFLTVKAESI
ncbi:MFS transporter [Candidatus Bathyarchaeota archaeon]|nr:MFS transporter [Candidatus Bathyarchaeota archaeon]